MARRSPPYNPFLRLIWGQLSLFLLSETQKLPKLSPRGKNKLKNVEQLKTCQLQWQKPTQLCPHTRPKGILWVESKDLIVQTKLLETQTVYIPKIRPN